MQRTRNLVDVGLQLWFWLTPIVYMPSIVPVQFRAGLVLNPLYPLVQAAQQVVLYGQAPDTAGLVTVMLVAALLLAMALLLFRRAAPDMVDVL